MPLVTDYTTLQTWIGNVLNRDDADFTADIPNFIQDAEAALRRDERARLLTDLSPFAISTEETDLPGDYDSLEGIAHEGPTVFGAINTVALDQINQYKIGGTTGIPCVAAVISSPNGHKLRWGPAPNATFNLRLQYWAKVPNLSDASPTNRFLSEHPDIYRYAALVESAPYLKDDARIAMWQTQLDNRLNQLEKNTGRALFSGSLNRPPPRRVF